MLKSTTYKTIPFALMAVLLFVGLISFAHAQETTVSGTTNTTVDNSETQTDTRVYTDVKKPSVVDAFGGVIQDRAEKFREDINAVRTNLQEKRVETKVEMDARRDDTLEQRAEIRANEESRREDTALNRDAKRAEMEERSGERKAEAEERRVENQERKTERRAELEAKKEERNALRISEMKARARAYIERTIKRFEAAITRLETTIGRVESRMAKFEERDIDTSEAVIFLAEAQTDLSLARTSLANIYDSVDIALSAEDPKRAFQSNVKTTFEETKGYVKSAHASIVNAVSSLKASLEVRSDNEVEVSATDEN
mgnify:CR=1 FL=1